MHYDVFSINPSPYLLNTIICVQVSALSKIGGHEVSLTTYAILNYMFLHQFALEIRLTPKSGKIGIATTRVLQVVRGE